MRSDDRKRRNGCLPVTNGNAKFTRIMINDSSSYSRVIRLTGVEEGLGRREANDTVGYRYSRGFEFWDKSSGKR